MNQKLIATYRESREGLFQILRTTIDKFLTRDPIDWRRSFGRPTRNIFVQLSFENFDPNSVTLEESWLLCNRPFLHTFWIDCDLETYKSSIKEGVLEWLTLLKEKDIHDWLIVVVVNTDNRVKNKILRNSVYDKVKNEFCSKHVERCIMLCEPYKSDSKTLGSYNLVASRIRILVIESITRVLDRFEENMRSQRERRIEPEWNFCSYFLLQEELSFMYEMIGLYEDALIQYDELDALFTQFVLNSTIAKPAPWLEHMRQNVATRWDGTCLCLAMDLGKRTSIGLNRCSILNLRSYLFSRQGHLLIQLSRISELIRRSVPFVHNCIKEVKLLQIQLPTGAIDCWTFLSCMEVLKFSPLDNKMESDEAKTMAYGSAELWNLATHKMGCIGKLCGLVSKSNKPSSDELMKVVDLLPGLVHVAGESKYLSELLESLSLKESFIQNYLDLSEQCICFLKHVGRIRSAKFIGKELAEFHMMIGDYEKAEAYLVDLLKMYKTDGWEMLANDIRLKIATCQSFLNKTFKCCRTCLNIASSATVNLDDRRKCLLDVIRVSKELVSEGNNERIKMRCVPAFVTFFQQPSYQANTNCLFRFILEIFSNLPSPIDLDSINICLRIRNMHGNVEESFKKVRKRNFSTCSDSQNLLTQKQRHKSHSRQNSGQSGFDSKTSLMSILGGFELFNRISETIMFTFQPIDIHGSVQYEETEDSQRLPLSSSLVCRSPLQRSLSSPKSQKMFSMNQEEDGDVVLETHRVTLQPGKNVIDLSGTFSQPGIYQASYLVMKLNQIDFVQGLYNTNLNFLVSLQPFHFSIPMGRDCFAGFNQFVEFSLENEWTDIEFLRIHTSDGLVAKCPNSAEVSQKEILLHEIGLQKLKETRKLNLQLFVSLDCWTSEYVSTKLVTFKSDGHADDVHTISFINPFKISSKVFTSFTKKYFQVIVSSNHLRVTEITSWELIDSSNDLTFHNLNDKKSRQVLNAGSTITLVWQMEGQFDVVRELKFLMNYKETDSLDCFSLGYSFYLDDIQTKIVTYLSLDKKELQLNEWTSLNISISQITDITDLGRLSYKIEDYNNCWQLSGDLEGEIKFMEQKDFRFVIDAKPLKDSEIKLPRVVVFSRELQEGSRGSSEQTSRGGRKISTFNRNWVFDKSSCSSVFIKTPNSHKTFHLSSATPIKTAL